MSSVERLPNQPESLTDIASKLTTGIASAIRGKDGVIDLLVISLMAEGHVLIEDVPGVGKTTLAKALAHSIDGVYGRIQFTPDLLPTDVVGVNIWLRGTERFELHRGPVFANILLADEVNRASPRTQSALLESMAERQVTIDGETHRLKSPFMVIATQNPLDHEGTHPLPESQLDRFLMRISLGYPDRGAELDMLRSRPEETVLGGLRPVIDIDAVHEMTAAAAAVHISPVLQEYLLDLITATRDHSSVGAGASPRAALALQRAAGARAATRGRNFVIPDDIQELAVPVLAHRMVMGPAGHAAGLDGGDVIREVLHTTRVPSPTRGQRRG